ncbi:MAG: UTP--glucose-1-phosphate uridylyltransferase [Candidatus Magasanikbacteria bacterium CG10_big_fil_rev_8_21_14_0_10_47_10]|uniref:UTP--glucose-1-phosphate uridylyltransferase n=1 Tax=Candidatus Magasanikbacteria bacterium CG10_big_fil_rev_8_21_14_0_10_47_10 TaxID=1974652 RepID=A0A2H0TQZ3_9BACT|nr:MAG: UTP--glucose-1-phosphate uridylyltransferase [Candidatus Magasanikbacteria bacterium CG10_big_fil_rev_8_21_14_0_10_47_10]
MSIKTAIIPAGGYGTRFLPASKTVPKEMFPLGSKPIIMHVVEEVVASGIENIIFVVSPEKEAIEHFFSSDETFEKFLTDKGKPGLVAEMRGITQMANFTYVYKKPPYGNGGALLAAEHLLRDDPFVLVWSDEIMLSDGEPRVKQCIDTFEKVGSPVISAVEIVDPKERQRYGMAELDDIDGQSDPTIKKIVRIVEKPAFGTEPSSYATHGAYVLTPEIFDAFAITAPGVDGELCITDLLNTMKPVTGLHAKIIPGARYFDCGNPVSYMKSLIDYGLSVPEYAKELSEFLEKKKI